MSYKKTWNKLFIRIPKPELRITYFFTIPAYSNTSHISNFYSLGFWVSFSLVGLVKLVKFIFWTKIEFVDKCLKKVCKIRNRYDFCVVLGATGVLVHVQGGGYGSREHLFGGRPPAHHGSKLHTSASSVSCESCSSRELADPPSTSSEEKGQIFRQVFDEFSRLSFYASRFQTAHTFPVL